MPNLENLTERDIEWIIVAVEAVAALPTTNHPEDKTRKEEWDALSKKVKSQHPDIAKRLDGESFQMWEL